MTTNNRLKTTSLVIVFPFFLVCLVVIQWHEVLGENNFPAVIHPPGFALFQKKCSLCHTLQRAALLSADDDTLRNTIRRMRDKHQADISTEEIDRLVTYHIWRQKNEASVFHDKCTACHPGKKFLEKNLAPAQTRQLIARMQQKTGNTITDEEIEIIVNYHIRKHLQILREGLIKSLRSGARTTDSNKPSTISPSAATDIVDLFLVKCSECHEPAQALNVFKDDKAWENTIARMRDYSNGFISKAEAEKLIKFHRNKQQREIEVFEKSCTVCHSEERINQRSMSEAEWRAVLRRMQQKKPELITDDKLKILADFYHRREMTLASLFYDRCNQCHLLHSENTSFSPQKALDNLIILAQEKLVSVNPPDIRSLLTLHTTRQQREMKVFQKNCINCHPRKKGEKKILAEEWELHITTLRGQPYTAPLQNSVMTQIQFHILTKKGKSNQSRMPAIPQKR